MKEINKKLLFLLGLILVQVFMIVPIYATADVTGAVVDDPNYIDPNLLDNFFDEGSLEITVAGESIVASSAVQLLTLFVLIALAPSMLIMLTSFARFIIVMHFVRAALATQTMPPNQILIGLALFLTFFSMAPVFNEIHENAIVPYQAGTLTQAQALEEGMEPLRGFMLANTPVDNIAFFAALSGETELDDPLYAPLSVLIPAFILGELTLGFTIGFLIFIPFVVIDMVVATILMSMGMMMLPPALISMPFKVLLFLLVDGWRLVIEIVVGTFVGFG